jgi:hypothetical protein
MKTNKPTQIYVVTLPDHAFRADSESEAMDDFLEFLRECVEFGDLTAFDFTLKTENEKTDETEI